MSRIEKLTAKFNRTKAETACLILAVTVMILSCSACGEGRKKYDNAVAYEIVKVKDISYPGNKRTNYRIVVSPEIKEHQVAPTAKKIIADIIAKDNDIDDICLWLYSDRKLVYRSAYDVAIALWTPDKITINVKENLEEYLQQRGKSEVKFDLQRPKDTKSTERCTRLKLERMPKLKSCTPALSKKMSKGT